MPPLLTAFLRRPAAVAAAVATAAGLATVTGCGTGGEPVSAGTTAPAAAPSPLWPSRSPAAVPTAEDQGKVPSTVVPGFRRVPSENIREVDPLAVIKAELAAHPGEVTGADGMDAATARKLADCAPGKPGCPLLAPVHRDITGNGKDDLILGFEMEDGLLGLRCYTFVHGVLTRIMATAVHPTSVEVAGRDLIVWEPSTTPNYAIRSVYSWDSHRHYMELQSDEIRRTDASGRPTTPARR
ncbi:hypothetical protein AB0I22_17245 [Streptomyces sp. NPDC050610]|uniref:hypothetical protein n=1 Tax=Streptomyces sp. NPDC050610 TaxID=3157097 RepID=UPI0034390A69